MRINVVFKALTSDIITRYAFGESMNYLTREDNNQEYFKTFEHHFEWIHLMFHVGWLASLIDSLPTEITMRLIPGIATLFKLRLVRFGHVLRIFRPMNLANR